MQVNTHTIISKVKQDMVNHHVQNLQRLKEVSRILSKHEDKTTKDERTHNIQNIQNTGNHVRTQYALYRSITILVFI